MAPTSTRYLAVADAGMVEGVGGEDVEEACHIVVALARVVAVLTVSTQHVLPHHVHHCLHVVRDPSLNKGIGNECHLRGLQMI